MALGVSSGATEVCRGSNHRPGESSRGLFAESVVTKITVCLRGLYNLCSMWCFVLGAWSLQQGGEKGREPCPRTDRHAVNVHTADQQNVETMGDIKEEFIDPGGRLGTLGLNHREQEMKAARITGRGCNRRQIKPSVAFLLTVTSKSLQILSHSLDTSWLLAVVNMVSACS